MALLTLQDIGKIYATAGNVAVGIRGVNLSFDRGEFVAVTGKSGSGKSTLLNVISGMDSYEEGELLIDGAPTSHYAQAEWEAYRQEYISFIFQDYNIIDSFTVLQNVELALMHIVDPRARRRRALELIERVGLKSHIRHKGSRLSGGQKQRTVIARALAKDSPIILADEPTGNLDSATSKEIMALLKEVSRDKLLIVVTHNFDEVEAYANRHIRIFDGAVESDHALCPPCTVKADTDVASAGKTAPAPAKKPRAVRDGLHLGRTLFGARPHLSVFLCALMTVGALCLFLVTALCGSAFELFAPNYMFTPVDGRVVIAHTTGVPVTDEELTDLAKELGAVDTLHYDWMLDETVYCTVPGMSYGIFGTDEVAVNVTYDDFGWRPVLGRKPEAKNEVLLCVPIQYQPYFGWFMRRVDTVEMLDVEWDVVGVSYYYDNTVTPRVYMTEEGFRILSAADYLSYAIGAEGLAISESDMENLSLGGWHMSFDIAPHKAALPSEVVVDYPDKAGWSYAVYLEASKTRYDYTSENGTEQYDFNLLLEGEDILVQTFNQNKFVTLGTGALTDMAEDGLSNTYRQASLFFKNDRAAHKAVDILKDKGYVAVSSDSTYREDALWSILYTIAAVFLGVVWLLSVVFIGFFLFLCSMRAIGSFRGDVAIMRSMGIPTKVIRLGVYTQMFIALIPAFVAVVLAAVLIFTSPFLNPWFVFMPLWQYAVLLVGLSALVLLVSRGQIRRLFKISVKTSLRGGDAV